MSRSKPRSALLPLVVGAVALVVAVVLGYVTIRDTTAAEPVSAEPTGVPKVATDRLVSEVGGFAFDVPSQLQASRQGDTVRLVSGSKELVVVVGPAGPGSLAKAQKRMLARLSAEYPKMRLLATESAEVNGNPTRTVYGQAVNKAGTPLRLAVVTVHAAQGAPRNFTVASYTADGAEPGTVLPLVNTVVNSFEVLSPGR